MAVQANIFIIPRIIEVDLVEDGISHLSLTYYYLINKHKYLRDRWY